MSEHEEGQDAERENTCHDEHLGKRRSIRTDDRPTVHAFDALRRARTGDKPGRASHIGIDEAAKQQPDALAEHTCKHAGTCKSHDARPTSVLRKRKNQARREHADDDLDPEKRRHRSRRHLSEQCGGPLRTRVRHSQHLAANHIAVDSNEQGEQPGQTREASF